MARVTRILVAIFGFEDLLDGTAPAVLRPQANFDTGNVPDWNKLGAFTMRKVVRALLAAGLVLGADAMAAQTSSADLVTACQREAARGQALAWRMEPSLRGIIEGQRRHMSEACAAFLLGGHGSTQALSHCLHAASHGQMHIQRDRNQDRAHVERQKDHCLALGGETKAKSVYYPLPE
ncbi:MAG: hypothetical protein SGJ03_04545 [Alphaproteobacteria bacterium]|nr:hypothetical protein [Alphaproteobacteria bacterium]